MTALNIARNILAKKIKFARNIARMTSMLKLIPVALNTVNIMKPPPLSIAAPAIAHITRGLMLTSAVKSIVKNMAVKWPIAVNTAKNAICLNITNFVAV